MYIGVLFTYIQYIGIVFLPSKRFTQSSPTSKKCVHPPHTRNTDTTTPDDDDEDNDKDDDDNDE